MGLLSLLRDRSDLVMELVLRVLLFSAYWYLEDQSPFYRSIKQEEVWRYYNPVKSHDTVPTPLLLTISLCLPSSFIITNFLATRQHLDLRQGILGLTLSASMNGVITNLIKLAVGRPRPDFFYRCYPDGQIIPDLQCWGNPDLVKEGRKSFPSGHSAWMFACFGFLSLYLMGKLKCLGEGGRGQGWRLCISLSPLVASTLVGLSRIQDCRHHWDDVLAGSIIGFLIACLCYFHNYPPPWSPAGHAPYSTDGTVSVSKYSVSGMGTSLTGRGGMGTNLTDDSCELGLSNVIHGNKLRKI